MFIPLKMVLIGIDPYPYVVKIDVNRCRNPWRPFGLTRPKMPPDTTECHRGAGQSAHEPTIAQIALQDLGRGRFQHHKGFGTNTRVGFMDIYGRYYLDLW